MFGLLDIQYVQVTAQYSNAVLMAIIPHVNDFARQLDIQTLLPITPEKVCVFRCDNHLNEIGGTIVLRDGYMFTFQHGHVQEFRSPAKYFGMDDFELIPRCYGAYHMTASQAVTLCRDIIKTLGYREDELYADLIPQVRSGGQVGSNTIPRYLISWVDPRDGSPSCSFEVNAEKRRAESVYFLNRALWRAPPNIDVQPAPLPGRQFRSRFQPVNPKYARALLPVALSAVDDYARRLALPVGSPVQTNAVKSYTCRKFDDQVYVHLILTNGYRFFYQNGVVQAFDASDAFFDLTARVAPVESISGKWRMSLEQAIELARRSVQKLGYQLVPLNMDKEPEVDRPHNAPGVPRFRLDWINAKEGVLYSRTVIEVDADAQTVKSIAIWDPKTFREIPGVGVDPGVPQIWTQGPREGLR